MKTNGDISLGRRMKKWHKL